VAVLALVNSVYLARENKKKRDLKRDGEGDRNAKFRYIT
jgi:hypothetical protein